MKVIYILLILIMCFATVVSAQNRLEVKDGRFYKDGKPFYPFGYVFGRTDEDMELNKKAGGNSLHTEYSFVDFYPDSSSLSKKGLESVKSIYETTNRHNITYFPLLTGHYIPGWFAQKMASNGAGGPVDVNGEPIGLWFQYSLHDPDFKSLLKTFWTDAATNFGADKNTGAYVLWNEPGYGLDATKYSIIDFKDYLKSKFNTIDNLNNVLGTKLNSFDEVYAPKAPDNNRKYWYEWVYYNQKSFADFFKEEAKIIKSIAPNALITNKNPVFAISGDGMQANNIPMQAEYQDFYGCDMYNGSVFRFRNTFEIARSLSRKSPVVTFETHQQRGLDEKDANLAISQLVAQIIGGCRGMMYFASGNEGDWGIFSDKANPPAVREKIINLGNQINANLDVFSAKIEDGNIAILYSNHSVIQYGTNHNRMERYDYQNKLEELYNMIRNRHYAVDFIADVHLKTYLKNYKVLVIPSYSILSDEELKEVANFHKNGGKIIAFSHSLEKTPYFENAPIPSFYGLKSRGVAPWNAGHIVLVDPIDELKEYMPIEITCQAPEIVDGLPMETNIPGYIVKTENKQTSLVASQDVFPSVICSNDGQVVYCAFESTNSEGLSLLLDGIITKVLKVEKEISVTNSNKIEATNVMTSISDATDKKVLMILNTGKNSGEYTFKLPSVIDAKGKNVINNKTVNIRNGAFRLKMKPAEYAFIKY